ncbi:MAG: hypothetical protein ABS35_30605 [Kaistia sp. SCN 65-12]|nr:MAG: hypothetical protein ABS35_30605 [Kaistia sp. SCN 65-12]
MRNSDYLEVFVEISTTDQAEQPEDPEPIESPSGSIMVSGSVLWLGCRTVNPKEAIRIDAEELEAWQARLQPVT